METSYLVTVVTTIAELKKGSCVRVALQTQLMFVLRSVEIEET